MTTNEKEEFRKVSEERLALKSKNEYLEKMVKFYYKYFKAFFMLSQSISKDGEKYAILPGLITPEEYPKEHKLLKSCLSYCTIFGTSSIESTLYDNDMLTWLLANLMECLVYTDEDILITGAFNKKDDPIYFEKLVHAIEIYEKEIGNGEKEN